MGSITLNKRAERRKHLSKNTLTRVDTQMIGTKKNTFQLELKNRFTTQTDPEEVPSIMTWEVEAALRKMKNGKEAGKDHAKTLKH